MPIEMSERTALFIHDAGGGSWEWCVWEDVFKQNGIMPYAISLEASELGLEHTNSDDYAAQVRHHVSKHQLTSFYLLGSGMGAMLALRLANEFQPRALVLINPLGPEALLANKENIPPVIDAGNHSREDKDWLEALSSNTQGSHLRERKESGAVLQDLYLRRGLPQLDCPCLVLVGEKEQVAPPEAGNELAEALKAEVISFGGTSHIGALLGFEAKAIARQVCQRLP